MAAITWRTRHGCGRDYLYDVRSHDSARGPPENRKRRYEGAMVFMKREYTQLAIFAAVLMVAIYFSLGSSTAIAFLAGALSSACAGWFGGTLLPITMSERLMRRIPMGKPARSQLPSSAALSWDCSGVTWPYRIGFCLLFLRWRS